MTNRAWMPLHIADYLADTGHLTATEHGAYMLLIMHYWQNGHLPGNEKLIARVARMTAAQWEESRDVIAMLFGPDWTHKRIDAELSKADDIIEKRRAAAESRYGKSKKDANAEQVQSKCTDTGVPPLTDNLASSLRSEPIQKKREADIDLDEKAFRSWFSSWPTFTTDDEDKARSAWQALSPVERRAVTANTPGYITTVKASKRDTWHAADKYLSKRLWERVKGRPPPPQTREQYLAAEKRRTERSWQ
jgi:uncharacterized protein YdaU (DUF1376 family)